MQGDASSASVCAAAAGSDSGRAGESVIDGAGLASPSASGATLKRRSEGDGEFAGLSPEKLMPGAPPHGSAVLWLVGGSSDTNSDRTSEASAGKSPMGRRPSILPPQCWPGAGWCGSSLGLSSRAGINGSMKLGSDALALYSQAESMPAKEPCSLLMAPLPSAPM